jgi:anti-sigma regulatory factor (Ser/Thr protein kinase)
METIKVKVPASPRYVGVVRLVAAGLASRLGFTIDDIEDLKIAVDELAAYLTGPQGRDGNLEIHFHVHDDRLEIEGFGLLAPGHGARTDLTDLSRQILDTVVDRASLSQADGRPVFSLMKAKTG